MYSARYSEQLVKKIIKIKKKDSTHYFKIRKKIKLILENPKHEYKHLQYNLKGVSRVHIGHFVLVFNTDHEKQTVSFEDYDHHDKIYN